MWHAARSGCGMLGVGVVTVVCKEWVWCAMYVEALSE